MFLNNFKQFWTRVRSESALCTIHQNYVRVRECKNVCFSLIFREWFSLSRAESSKDHCGAQDLAGYCFERREYLNFRRFFRLGAIFSWPLRFECHSLRERFVQVFVCNVNRRPSVGCEKIENDALLRLCSHQHCRVFICVRAKTLHCEMANCSFSTKTRQLKTLRCSVT